jgi:hypothetical protein
MNDPILNELHRTRERLLEESGGTLASLVSKLKKDQLKSGRVLRDTRRTKDCTEADGRPQSDGSSVSSAR